MFAPVFEQEGNRFLMRSRQFLAETEEEARLAGLGAMPVECIILNCKWTKEVIAIEGISAVETTLGAMPVFIISGPLFEEVAS